MTAKDNLPAGDTIAARATPPGRGGVGIVRVSGPGCAAVARAMLGGLPPARVATLRTFRDACGEAVDTGLALYFPAPHSFTGEDVLELQAHGGPVVLEMLLEAALALGARPAAPGEFSRRAFLNDRLDLSQAEAIADLIDSSSRAAARAAQRSLRGDFGQAVLALNGRLTDLRVFVEAAMDFPDEDIDFLDDRRLAVLLEACDKAFVALLQRARQGVLLRDGVHVVVAGRPNAGKSSLLNALAGYAAAIVTPEPGTTRDLVREQLDLDGLPLHLVDTAGLRADPGPVEAEGIRRAHEQLAQADHALLVVDATTATAAEVAALRAELPAGLACTVVRNKVDLTGEPAGPLPAQSDWLNISALTGAGLPELKARLLHGVGFTAPDEGSIIARQRHLEALRRAGEHLAEARRQLREQRAGELMADELLQAQNALAEITGEFGSDDLLGEIFARFCIGK